MDNVLCDGVGRSGFRTEDAYQWNGRLMTGFDFMILMDEVQQIQLLTFVFMQTLGLDIPAYGMVKDDKHRTRAIAKEGGEIQISANKPLFKLLTNIQDEVHRYSINFQRVKHKQKTYELELTEVPGIGQAKAQALMKAFKTKQDMKNATPEELRAAAKIGEEKAQELYRFIQERF